MNPISPLTGRLPVFEAAVIPPAAVPIVDAVDVFP